MIMMKTTSDRGTIRTDGPRRDGHGTSRRWTRVIAGTPYAFTAVMMPDGERRYFVSRYNGYGDMGTPESRAIGMRFACAWSPVHSIIVKPAPVQMYDTVSHPSYMGTGQVRGIDAERQTAYVMYVDDDGVEGYWLPIRELSTEE